MSYRANARYLIIRVVIDSSSLRSVGMTFTTSIPLSYFFQYVSTNS